MSKWYRAGHCATRGLISAANPEVYITVADVAQIAGKNCAFKSNSVNSNLEIKSATLWFHITETPKSTGSVIHESHLVRLYKAFKAPGKVADPRELFHSQQLNSTGWYSVQISAVVKEWFSLFSKQDMSLDIAVIGPNTLEVGCGDGEANKPFLVVDTEEKKLLNRKRRNGRSKERWLRSDPAKNVLQARYGGKFSRHWLRLHHLPPVVKHLCVCRLLRVTFRPRISSKIADIQETGHGK